MLFPPTIPANARPVQSAWPELTCYGCGPANPDGLGLSSYVADDEVLVAVVSLDDQYQVSPGVVYGGTVASLIDCHGVWTAMTFRSPPDARPPDHPPTHPFATGELSVRYEAPSPIEDPLYLRGRSVEVDGRKVTVDVEVGPAAGVTAHGRVVAFQVGGYGGSTPPRRDHPTLRE